mmetsp:Transcript_18947/g.36856  ORF Transcript_18947/g.36856 Transcript_18947/m.36856 type:complete len:149 (-) Transcript_18947:21-467(-)
MGPLLRCKWVYKAKMDANGDLIKRKSRIVVRGDMQGEDTYDDTFSPTSRPEVFRTLVSIATQESMWLKQLDIQGAFLSAHVDRDNIYMAAPPGYEAMVPRGKCLRLKRSLYGLKQASHLYHKELKTWLLDYGFQAVNDEGTLFRYERN